ncbi:MAG: choice-of-anchor V domain-containing protein [Planctomycetota bacterium]
MITLRTSIFVAAPALVLLAANLSTRAAGVESNNNSVPANCSSAMPSCSACHSASAPQAGRTNGPTTTIAVTSRVLTAGQQTSVTTSLAGGLATTQGGFICEASAGTFTAGSTSHIISNPASITHTNKNNRSWTYTYTAPNTPGLVTLTAAGISVNGSGSGGDEFSFSGYDINATTATPTRLFVLPTGHAAQGTACPDGYGNYSVLGANGVPTLGNASYAFQLHGATPGSVAILFAGMNPAGFTFLDLGALYGITGCRAYVASPMFTFVGFTSAGQAQRGEGSATFPMAVGTSAALHGLSLDVQVGYVDPTAVSLLGRSMQFSFSNGLRMTFQ